MSKGKAALKRLFGSYVSSKCYGINYKQDDEDYNIIKQDLERLEELERSYQRLEFVYKNECEEYDKMISDMNYNYGVAKLLIDTLQEENEKLAKEYEEECKEWADIVERNDKAHLFFVNNQAKLIEKYMQAFDIFKDKNIRIFTRNCCIDNKEVITYHLASDYNTYNLTQEQYKLLDEINKINASLVKKV